MKAGIHNLFVLVALELLSSGLFAADVLVPSQYPTIQTGIGAAVDGDRVIVAKDTYYENINFGGKSITVTSTDLNDPAATVIDANGSGTVVTFPDVASANCVLAGFTVTNGNTSVNGGGMLCLNGHISVNNCIISDNSATENGGGIYVLDANVTLADCVFSRNRAYGVGNLAGGGGIFTRYGGLMLTDCRFSENAAVNSSGGGIRCTDAELILAGCRFVSNSSVREGGGISTDAEPATLTDCTFNANSGKYGGGMCNSHRGATVTNCVFASNSAERGGGICAMQLHEGDLRVENCTFSGNFADYFGGALCDEDGGHSVLINCIFWGNLANEGPQIALEQEATASVSYCCVQGGELDIYTGPSCTVSWLVGNIHSDPCFADAGSGDCHLRSVPGRWDPNQEAWVIDGDSSLCIDAGNPGCPPADEPAPNGSRVNMGAYGATAEASKSPPDWAVLADLTNDRAVDYTDLCVLVDYWLEAGQCIPADLNHDQSANFRDFAIFADNWHWEQ
jgi:parallel beta-helix repeat protein/predicted outer membrane repeat protein